MKPQKIFTKEEIKNWSLYEQQLENYPIVSEHLGNTFKNWVTKLDNPFSIVWFRKLFDKKLDGLEQTLSGINGNNPALLEKIVSELYKENANEECLINKILSLDGELLTYKWLLDKFPNVKPMSKIGDFICNDEIIVSVKLKNDEHFSEFIIGEYIQGLLWLDEYSLLKSYDYNFEVIDGIGYKFKTAILNFLINAFVNIINELPEPVNEYDYNPLTRDYDDGLNVKADKYISINQKKVELIFTYQKKTFKIVLQNNENYRLTDINGVKVYSYEGQKYNLNNIKKSINYCLKDFDSKAQNENQKKFWGWINVPLTYSNENGFSIVKEEIKKELQQLCRGKSYKTIFYFYPYICFEIDEPFFFEFN